MDLTVETKQYTFSMSSGFDQIVIFLSNQLKEYPDMGSHHYLTRKEVQRLIAYLKEHIPERTRGSYESMIDRLENMEILMEGKEKAEFRFW
jgi:hypothetical protein